MITKMMIMLMNDKVFFLCVLSVSVVFDIGLELWKLTGDFSLEDKLGWLGVRGGK